MVVVTDTLHQPLTVMVKTNDTVFTHVTVFRVIWYHNLEENIDPHIEHKDLLLCDTTHEWIINYVQARLGEVLFESPLLTRVIILRYTVVKGTHVQYSLHTGYKSLLLLHLYQHPQLSTVTLCVYTSVCICVYKIGGFMYSVLLQNHTIVFHNDLM